VLFLNECTYHLHLGAFPSISYSQSARFQGMG